MIQDAKWRFHVLQPSVPPTLANELLVVTGVTAYTSEPFDLASAGYADGGGELLLRVNVEAGGASAGTGVALELLDAAALNVNGYDLDTPAIVGTKSVAQITTTIAATKAELWSFILPQGLRRYIAFRVTPTTSTNNTTTFKAGIVTS